jgi:hypothetical protein
MNPLCLAADLLEFTEARTNLARRLRQLTVREAEVEDGSLGTATLADFGFTISDFTFDIGIYCRRSVDYIACLHCLAVRKTIRQGVISR